MYRLDAKTMTIEVSTKISISSFNQDARGYHLGWWDAKTNIPIKRVYPISFVAPEGIKWPPALGDRYDAMPELEVVVVAAPVAVKPVTEAVAVKAVEVVKK
jgi:hypothetical protein